MKEKNNKKHNKFKYKNKLQIANENNYFSYLSRLYSIMLTFVIKKLIVHNENQQEVKNK